MMLIKVQRKALWVSTAAMLCAWSSLGAAESVASLEGVRERLAHGEKKSAYRMLKRLVAEGNREPDAFLFLGVLTREQGSEHYDAAIAWFERGLGYDPHYPALLLELAVTYSWADQYAKSIATYDRLLGLQPDHRDAQLGKARVSVWAGKHEDALAIYQQVVQQEPKHIEALRGIALIHRIRMRFDESRRYYHTVLAQAPEDEESKEGLREIAQATRWQLEAGAILAGSPSQSLQFGGLASVAYKLNPEVTLRARYVATAQQVLLGRADELGDVSVQREIQNLQHNAEINASFKIIESLTLSPQYGVRVVEENVTHLVGLRLDWKFHPQLVLLGGMRPGFSHDAVIEALLDTGIQYIPLEHLWLMVQGFVFVNTESQRNWSTLFTTWIDFLNPVAFKVGAGVGQIQSDISVQFLAAINVLITRDFEVAINYEMQQIFIERHMGQLSLILRI